MHARTRLLLCILLAAGAATGSGRHLAPFTEPRLDGSMARSDDFAGQVLLLAFWATWCKPCVKELPILQDIYERYRGDRRVAVLAVHCSLETQSISEVRAFVKRLGLSLPVLYDADRSMRRSFGSGGIPRTFLIDGQGRLVAVIDDQPRETLFERASREIDRLLRR